MQAEYKESYFLSAGEVNAEGEMSIPLLTSKIIDIATAHANSLGIGNPDMGALGFGWVLSRLTIEMNQWPIANHSYSITTWIEDWNRHFSMRCFMIADEKGNPLGYARSIWMVMDTVKRENAGLSHLNLPKEMISTRECPIARQTKHLGILPSEIDVSEKHNFLIATFPPRKYTFKYCDIDYYRHVNTVRYVTLLLNQFPLETYDHFSVRRIELNFLHEAHYGQEVMILTSGQNNPTPTYSLTFTAAKDFNLQSAKTPMLFARIFFTKRDNHS